MREIRVLFLPLYGPEAPSSRLRVYQYLPLLSRNGFRVETLPAPPAAGRAGRLRYLFRVLGRARAADAVFLQKQVFSGGIGLLARVNPRIVFDFDDAIFTRPPWEPEPGPGAARRLGRTLARVRAVIAGNAYLAARARDFVADVTVIPTAVDLEAISRVPREERAAGGRVRIGWTGTQENLYYLRRIAGVFPRLAARHPKQLVFRVISNRPAELPGVECENLAWTLADEYRHLSGLDLGLAPLGDDPWSRGKCGFKAIQYMSLGIPAVAARAGFYPEFIADGENGLLAGEIGEWEEKISRLVEDRALRERLGDRARETVAARFSREVVLPRLQEVLTRVAGG